MLLHLLELLSGNRSSDWNARATVSADNSILILHLSRLLIQRLSLVEVHHLRSMLQTLHTMWLSTLASDEYLLEGVLAMEDGRGSAGLATDGRDINLLGVHTLSLTHLVLGVKLGQLLVDGGVATVLAWNLLELDRLPVASPHHLELRVLRV